MNKLKFGLLVGILILGFAVRLYKFNSPIADWHSWRQADTSSVSRNFVSTGFDLLHPRFDDLSNVPSNKYDNPQGYRFVEFPVYNVMQAGLFIMLGHITIEQWGRMVTIFCSLFSAVFLYLIVKKREGFLTGLLAAFFFVFLPFNIYYSRTILPDPLMATFILGAIYYFDLWLTAKSKLQLLLFFVLTCIFSAGAFLIKPFAGFFMLPMLYLAFEKYGFNLIKKWQLWLLAIVALLPFGAWRLWMQQYPAGIPQSWWLFNGSNIRFKGAFFQWLFAQRIGEMILGYWGLVLFGLGLIFVKKKNYLFFVSFLVASLLYLFVVATGNVQHDYYQIPIIPSLAIFLGIGSAFLINPAKEIISRYKTVPILIIAVLFMFAFSWFAVRAFYDIDNPAIIVAGAAVDKLTPKNAKVIANYNGDTSFLYQTKRKGWASFEKGLPQMVQMGADYLALINPTPADIHLGTLYKIIAQTPQYIIFDLRQKP
ncbi:MAG TPA: glycosyltransferase family 39 protein [Patescibacteria group bacterium]|nr:glycosyltransferase family 39 protein [Patescibacteria group bacterium]